MRDRPPTPPSRWRAAVDAALDRALEAALRPAALVVVDRAGRAELPVERLEERIALARAEGR